MVKHSEVPVVPAGKSSPDSDVPDSDVPDSDVPDSDVLDCDVLDSRVGAKVVNLTDRIDQRASELRGQIDLLDGEISELYSQKIALTRQLAGVLIAP